MGCAVPPEIRFLRFVDRGDDGDDTCWLWRGGTGGSKSTYGYFHPGSKTSDPKVMAHRFAYEMWVGPIPEGLELDHLCRRSLCVRPLHLEPVTHEENSRRARLDICRAGLHDLRLRENQYFDDRGRRRGCIPCRKLNDKRQSVRRRARRASSPDRDGTRLTRKD